MIRKECSAKNAGKAEIFLEINPEKVFGKKTGASLRLGVALLECPLYIMLNQQLQSYSKAIPVCKSVLFSYISKVLNCCKEAVFGRLDIARDWGWAPEYVEAMWLMLQQDSPDDYVIATGQTHTLESFVSAAFAVFDLDWRRHVEQNPKLFRPTDLLVSRADPSKAVVKLGWKAKFGLSEVIEGMVSDVNGKKVY